jgi:hypothetical protein
MYKRMKRDMSAEEEDNGKQSLEPVPVARF